jgi:hypothetical protein
MNVFILKNPKPDTVAIIADKPDAREGWEQMTDTEARQWVDAQTATESAAVPQSITLLQLRLWLIGNGMLSTVENIIATRANWPSEKAHDEAKTRWQFRTDVLRSSDMVNTLGAALGLTQEQIDAAFIAADRLS